MRGQRESAKYKMTVSLYLENACSHLDVKLVVRKGNADQSGAERFVFSPLASECEH